jgi:exopolysaccharide biosynthesis polyprenyl glycosylphosphotransferase
VNETKRRLLLGALKLSDLGLIVLAFCLAIVRVAANDGPVSVGAFLSMRIKLSNFLIFGVFLLVCYFILNASGLYSSKRLSTRSSESLGCLKATTLVSLLVLVMATLFRITMVTPSFFLSFWVCTSALFVIDRAGIRYLLGKLRRHGRNLRNVLILGTNSRAIEFANKIKAKPEAGYRILGFVDDDWIERSKCTDIGYELSCTCENLPEYLRRNVVDEVAMFLPLRSFYEYAAKVAALCELHGIVLRCDGAIFNLKLARSRAVSFDGEVLITASAGHAAGWPILIKRAVDVVTSLLLLVALCPLFAVVMLLIKITSKGPIFFLQDRVGLNKRIFRIYKFRTMVPDADKLLARLEPLNEASGPVFKIKNDPRMTSIGKLLRRTSIDELPQLLNVLKGDMSLVGPRPLPVRDYEGFNQDWQRRRFSVRPGITCLWQVNGRSSIAFEKWMQLDLQYLDEWSLWLDLKILARTIPAVVRGSGAA